MTTDTLTTTQRSAAIRAALKARGISSKDVSIRTDYYSGGSSIRIRVKNPNVSAAMVESIANEHENIHRDQFGDILSGGNRFVFVDYAPEAVEHFASLYREAVDRACQALDAAGPNALITVDGTDFALGKVRGTTSFVTVWEFGSGCLSPHCNTPEEAARLIGQLIANRRTA